MKKRLEAELISIAHRILKLKNRSELDQLYKETQKLYETLSVLKFYQDNFESVKSDVSEEVLEEKLQQSNEVEAVPETLAEVKAEVVEPMVEAEPEIEEKAEEEVIVSEEPEVLEEEETLEKEPEEEIVADEEPSFKPSFELEEDDEEVENEPAKTASEEKLEDHIGKYADPVFVKPNEVSLFPENHLETKEEIKAAIPTEQPKSSALNEAISKSIAIGLNDRIGFVQHLFNDSNEDFNRVISKLNTFDTFEEAKNFINEMVIPDYNYWVGEEDYIERFMEIVEKKFQ